jgi:hypothetical protein
MGYLDHAEEKFFGYQHHGNRHRSDNVFSIIINLVLLYVVINLLKWNLNFITPSFRTVEYFVVPLICLHIFGSLLELVFFKNEEINHITKIFNHLFGFINVLVLLIVFPFQFTSYDWPGFMPVLIRIILIIIASLLAAVIVSKLAQLPILLKKLKNQKNNS